MKRFFFTITLLLALALPALAQASGYVGFHAPVAEQGGNPADDLGVNFGGQYQYKRFFAGLDSFVNDGFGSRHRFFGGATVFKSGEHKFGVEGGYHCAVRCGDGAFSVDGGFGGIRYDYERFHGFFNIGNDRFLLGEVALDVAKLGPLGLQVFGRGNRVEFGNNTTQTVYPIGLRFTFAQGSK